MIRFVALLAALTLTGSAQAATLHLERVVLVMRHGVRPPTQTNADLAKFSDKAWPGWPVAPGELTPHGGETVRLVAATVRDAYRAKGLLPATGCAGAGQVTVWADGADHRTQQSGSILAEALQPGCGLTAPFSDVTPRDPIFGGYASGPCSITAQARALFPKPEASDGELAQLKLATDRLQAIFAPTACNGGPGVCFAKAGPAPAPFTGSLAEDLLLEFADGKPMSDVGWGRADAAAIRAVMPLHERGFALIRQNLFLTTRSGNPMARVILDALRGRPTSGGPQSGPDLKLMGLAGHDTNLALMAGVFGLAWTLPGEPDGTAPSTALAFELWSDGAHEYVRPVIYYETLEQLRTLKPAAAKILPLTFTDCADGPMGSCSLATVEAHLDAVLPADCTGT
jgi:4-phytase/acid phosphatase